MLPPREKMTICFAHVAYRFADRFALRGAGIDFFEVRNRCCARRVFGWRVPRAEMPMRSANTRLR